jgi:hypothetical protein
MSGWVSIEVSIEDDDAPRVIEAFHVVPDQDLRAHDASTICWCRPELTSWNRLLIYKHHAADGREAFETGERKPS